MTQLSYPWVSTAGDRVIKVGDLADIFNSQFPTGVFDGLTVSADVANLVVAAGAACVNGIMYRNTDDVTLTPAVSAKSYVVLRLTAADRAVVVAMLAGSAGAYPVLTQTDAVYEIALAKVDTSVNNTPTDTRSDPSVCGIIAPRGYRRPLMQGVSLVTWVSGWTGANASLSRDGDTVAFHIYGSWGFGAVVPTTGAVSIIVATIPEAYRPSTVSRHVSGTFGGRAAVYEVSANGQVAIVAIGGTGNVPANGVAFVSGTYLI